MLVNWFYSSFSMEEPRRDSLLLLPQIRTDVVTTGVIEQIRNKDATFHPNMYYWARSKLINSIWSLPGCIEQSTWLTDKRLGGIENGKDGPTSQSYSNSEEIQNKTVSKQSPFKNGIEEKHKENMPELENISDYSPTKNPKPTSLPIRRKRLLSSLSDQFSTLSIDQPNIPAKQINGNTPDEKFIKIVNGIQSSTKRTSISSTPQQNSKDTPSLLPSSIGGDSTLFYTPVGMNDLTYNGLSPLATPKSPSLNKVVFGGITSNVDPSDNSTVIQSSNLLLSSPKVVLESTKCNFSANSLIFKKETDEIHEKQIPPNSTLSLLIDSDSQLASTTDKILFSPKNYINTPLYSPLSKSTVSPVTFSLIKDISISLHIPSSPQLTGSIVPPSLPSLSQTQLSGSTIILPPLLNPSVNYTPPPPPPILYSTPSGFPTPQAQLLNKSYYGFNGPPPPPLPMSFSAPPVVLRKKPITPPVPMRPLYWTRIILKEDIFETYTPTTPDSPDSLKPLWSNLKEAPIPNINKFTQLFSRQIVEPKLAKKKIEEFKQLLDTKRSRNVGILAKSLHLDFSEIENALYNFDTSVVSAEVLQQIYEMSATEEELVLIKSHVASYPDQPLDKPEQFLLKISEIIHFGERVACLTFQSDFNDALNNIANKLNNMKVTSVFLMTSESLKKVFGIILALGNYMNGGNRQRGQAEGFGLEILPKLRDVKSNDNSMTLLHFIVQTYINECKEPMKETLPVPEPSDVDRAAHVTFDDLQQCLNELKIKLAGCKKKADKVKLSSAYDSLELFKTKMESFISMAHRKLENEYENLEESKKLFNKLIKFYQFPPKTSKSLLDVAPKDFFSVWLPFCTDFKDCWKMEQQRIVKEKLIESKRKTKKRQQLVKTNNKLPDGLKNQIQLKFK